LEAIARHRLAAIPHRRNDRSYNEGHRLAAALGARLSCRRGAQAPQAEARLEEGGRQPGLPNRERRSRQAHLSPAPTPAGLRAMPRVKIGPALPDREKLDIEIARLRDLDVGQLRSRWHTAFGRPAPAHPARHLLFRSLAYRLQADRLGDLDRESQRLLDRSGSPEKAGRNAVDLSRQTTQLPAGPHPGPRMERADAAGGSACRWLCLERQHLSQPVESGLRDHRHALERAEILRPARQAIEKVLTMKTRSTKVVRCAIYTRVSTDQGLEQDFNSLDAQY